MLNTKQQRYRDRKVARDIIWANLRMIVRDNEIPTNPWQWKMTHYMVFVFTLVQPRDAVLFVIDMLRELKTDISGNSENHHSALCMLMTPGHLLAMIGVTAFWGGLEIAIFLFTVTHTRDGILLYGMVLLVSAMTIIGLFPIRRKASLFFHNNVFTPITWEFFGNRFR